jgi:transposase-like protein
MGWRRQSRPADSGQLKGRKAALFLVAVDKQGRNTTGRERMEVTPDFRRETLLAFLNGNVAPRSTVYIDGLKNYTGLKEAGFEHAPAANRCELISEKARSPWCLWPTARGSFDRTLRDDAPRKGIRSAGMEDPANWSDQLL